jgi:hypothetical protein
MSSAILMLKYVFMPGAFHADQKCSFFSTNQYAASISRVKLRTARRDSFVANVSVRHSSGLTLKHTT